MQFNTIFIAFVVDRLENSNLASQKYSYFRTVSCHSLKNGCFGIHLSMYKFRDDGCQHIKISFHNGDNFLWSILFLHVDLETLQITELCFDGFHLFFVSAFGRHVEILHQHRFFLLEVLHHFDHFLLMIFADLLYELLLFFLD